MKSAVDYEMLRDAIIDDYGEILAGDINLFQDAISLELLNGTLLEIKAASNSEYSFIWKYGAHILRLDTAPLHPELATFPHHLHDAGGVVRPDPVTTPGRPLADNVRRLLAALGHDPLLTAG
ncbi:toxin-antitoxin system TumE family protein [Pseudogulbenkiania subflava]|uniref:Uncharacterized protein n=1 Tax=Pseudogulbenkiania subflava DSM 22618 TaxID=1123014 RepID=A0A1Y6BAC2_9NEIS|nr:DUF6516 family protein [Pseudogulbenkiania subflava]SMF01369.1 hypothetical protein SAMN02745746_00716 [Pseudogulbenkiania subflava DSM 22618]